jgi:hypothetical protein
MTIPAQLQGWQEFQQTETFAITKQLSKQINWWFGDLL